MLAKRWVRVIGTEEDIGISMIILKISRGVSN